MNIDQSQDRRIQRTRTALRDVFFELVVSRPYQEIAVKDIIDKAGVGRSTFYQHYSGKDDLLLNSLKGPMGTLALAIMGKEEKSEVAGILDHFWENRYLARQIFTGASRRVVVCCLAEALRTKGGRLSYRTPGKYFYEGMAEMLISLIVTWLTGRTGCMPGELATDIVSICEALVEKRRPTHTVNL